MATDSSPVKVTTSCPSDESLSCFVEGISPEEERELIRRHIDDCPVCLSVLASFVRSPGGLVSNGPARGGWPRTFEDGARIAGRYEVIRFIARGGMGEVYEVLDTALGERVALKTIVCSGLDEPHLLAHMAKEVRLARKVTHPNVCRILEFGHHVHRSRDANESVPFLTMELLSGDTLAQHLRRQGRLPVPEILPIATQILDALDAIHGAGIVHRDLKPDNVHLMRTKDGGIRAVVTDFGLAKSVETATHRPGISSDSYVVGTPEYMAPEQGVRAEPKPAWDIYAFGVILFELAAGSRPTKSEFIRRSLFKQGGPVPMPDVGRDIPRGFSNLVSWCLEKDPSRRCPRTGEIRRTLDQIEKELARGAGRRSRIVLALGVVLAVAALGGWLFR